MINRRGICLLAIIIIAILTGAFHMQRQSIIHAYVSPEHQHARDEQLHSLLDGRARWPDGSLREIGVPLFDRLQAKEKAGRSVEADLIAERVAVGASSPLGRRYSQRVEQAKNGVPTEQTEWEIEQLKRDGGAYVHDHHASYMR